MEVKHSKLGYNFTLPELTQRQLEEFENIFNPMVENVTGVKVAVFNGCLVKAAAQLEWIPLPLKEDEEKHSDERLKPDQVGDMNPGAVSFLSTRIGQYISEAREVPPE